MMTGKAKNIILPLNRDKTVLAYSPRCLAPDLQEIGRRWPKRTWLRPFFLLSLEQVLCKRHVAFSWQHKSRPWLISFFPFHMDRAWCAFGLFSISKEENENEAHVKREIDRCPKRKKRGTFSILIGGHSPPPSLFITLITNFPISLIVWRTMNWDEKRRKLRQQVT